MKPEIGKIKGHCIVGHGDGTDCGQNPSILRTDMYWTIIK